MGVGGWAAGRWSERRERVRVRSKKRARREATRGGWHRCLVRGVAAARLGTTQGDECPTELRPRTRTSERAIDLDGARRVYE